jgi:Flp pilus assembly protein TadD
MDFPSLTEIQPYLTAIGTALSVATLGFVLNVAKLMSDASKLRAEVLEERVRKSQEEVERTEKWSAREQAKLTQEIDTLRAQIAGSLSGAGVVSTLDTKEAVARLSVELRSAIDSHLGELRGLVEKREAIADGGDPEPEVMLQLGQGYMATGHWQLAGQYFDKYVSENPGDWEAQYVRGVAYANARAGRETNLAALRAYNEAIAFGMELGTGLPDAYRARLFIYRGAILKRLGRTDEAEADLNFGLTLATADYEKMDAVYNLACVYAMRHDKPRLLGAFNEAQTLLGRQYIAEGMRAHMHDYFAAYSHDKEFLKALEQLEQV